MVAAPDTMVEGAAKRRTANTTQERKVSTGRRIVTLELDARATALSRATAPSSMRSSTGRPSADMVMCPRPPGQATRGFLSRFLRLPGQAKVYTGFLFQEICDYVEYFFYYYDY